MIKKALKRALKQAVKKGNKKSSKKGGASAATAPGLRLTNAGGYSMPCSR